MRARVSSLLCELHAHTTWSDGELSLAELVDLYGSAGFDVLCVTDHVLRRDDPWPARNGRPCVDEETVTPYLEAIAHERDRARSTYGLLLVPGLELTYNDPDPDRACHAVAVGLERPRLDGRGPRGYHGGGPRRGRRGGRRAPLRARSPLGAKGADALLRTPLARARRALRPVELFNGGQLFGWVAEHGLRPVAAGDLPRAEQFLGWTTLVPCEQDAEALVDYLRSPRPVFLTRLERDARSLAA